MAKTPFFECQCGTDITNFHETSHNVFMGKCPSCNRWWRFERTGGYWKYQQIPDGPLVYRDVPIPDKRPPNLYAGRDLVLRPLSDLWRKAIDGLDMTGLDDGEDLDGNDFNKG